MPCRLATGQGSIPPGAAVIYEAAGVGACAACGIPSSHVYVLNLNADPSCRRVRCMRHTLELPDGCPAATAGIALPGGRKAAIGLADGDVYKWDMRDGGYEKMFDGYSRISAIDMLDGTLLASAREGPLLTTDVDSHRTETLQEWSQSESSRIWKCAWLGAGRAVMTSTYGGVHIYEKEDGGPGVTRSCTATRTACSPSASTTAISWQRATGRAGLSHGSGAADRTPPRPACAAWAGRSRRWHGWTAACWRASTKTGSCGSLSPITRRAGGRRATSWTWRRARERPCTLQATGRRSSSARRPR